MKKHTFWYRNSLSIVFLSLMLGSLIVQYWFGWKECNKENSQKGLPTVTITEYARTGHFIQATFENWESEFFQMGLYVLLTVFLRQWGSSESKSFDEEEEVDKEPEPKPDSPWPVRKGGWVLWLYKYSLTLAFLFLFLFSFAAHAYGTWLQLKEEEDQKLPFLKVFTEDRFWFESFQNWQSEFLSVASIVILSIFLRQKGSPESKPVDAPYSKTGK